MWYKTSFFFKWLKRRVWGGTFSFPWLQDAVWMRRIVLVRRFFTCLCFVSVHLKGSWKPRVNMSGTAVLMVDLSMNSSCFSHSWLERLTYLKDYLFPFSFHLHLKFSGTPKGMWINVRSGKSIAVMSLFQRHERECHSKSAAPKYFRLRERVWILIAQLSSFVDSLLAERWQLFRSKWDLHSLSGFHWECLLKEELLIFCHNLCYI